MNDNCKFKRGITTVFFIFSIVLSVHSVGQSSYKFNDSFYYLFPFPGATEINPNSNIIIKSRRAFCQLPNYSQFTVSTGKNRTVSGQILLKEENHTLIFIPDIPFNTGDQITVSLNGACFDNIIHNNDLAYCFYIKSEEPIIQYTDEYSNWLPEKDPNRGVKNITEIQLPEGYPYYEMGFQSNPTPDQYFFQASQVGQFFQLITDNDGVPYFYRKTPSRCLDFKVNENGYITYYDASKSAYVELDSAYQYRKIYHASFGLDTDNHDLLVMPNGYSWIIGREYIVTDMSQYVECGNSHANVLHFVIEEKDALGTVLWQWRTFDHFNVMDGDPDQVDFCKAVIDFAHVNSLALDPDGNVIISSRSLNEITKIDKETGQIIWRLGGVNNQFTFVDDPLNGFTDQHMAREDEAGVLTLFDNGNYHQPPHSRGVKYAIDTVQMTASYLVGYDDNMPTVITNPMGSLQTLNNGNVVVGWTQNQQGMCLTEYDAEGNKLLEMHQSTNATLRSYRSLKYPWKTTYFYPQQDTIDFGEEVPVGATITQSVSIVNPNQESLEVTGSYLSSIFFNIQNTLPFTIAGHSSKDIDVTFHPTLDGDYEGYAYLMTQNDSTGISLKMTLTGSTLLSGTFDKDSPEIRISPNPFLEQLNIQSIVNQEVRVIVYQGTGIKMEDRQLASLQSAVLKTTDWKSGIYLIEIHAEDRVWRRKLVKF